MLMKPTLQGVRIRLADVGHPQQRNIAPVIGLS
jgi:hypothetical protein